MKAVGYVTCSACGREFLQGYAPRNYKDGDQLCAWSHTEGSAQLGWGRQPKCPGSYKPGTDTRLSSDLQKENRS